ncbi:hypothetical protein GCM10009623_34260 [Nocardioides aestuarii]|uniref:Phage holin family protein n=1 Tax=Nocardioides aestuarii TaxID=252231 RepID=A0ABW4TQ77_9ACTN
MTPTEQTDGAAEPTLGALVHDLSTQIPELVRSELRLAQAELAETGRRAGLGAGLLGAAGVTALYGVAVLLAAVVLALSLVLPAWAAALVVAVALLAGAGVLALRGKGQVERAAPATPERAIAGIKEDVETVKGHHP